MGIFETIDVVLTLADEESRRRMWLVTQTVESSIHESHGYVFGQGQPNPELVWCCANLLVCQNIMIGCRPFNQAWHFCQSFIG